MKGRAQNDRWALFSGWFDFGCMLTTPAKVVLMLASIGSLLLLWEFAPRSDSVQTLLPTVSQVATTMGHLFTEKDFAVDVAASLKRIAISFAIAAMIALPLGLLMGAFPAAEGFFNPLVSPLRYLPAPSFIPLLLALLGTGDEQKIALLVLGVVWFLISLVMDDTKRVPLELVEASRTLGAGRLRAVAFVILPCALPFFVDTMRQMLAVSWTYLVIAEIVASTDGIGAVMMRARRLIRMDIILACILTIGALGFLSDALFRSARWLAFPYLRHTR
jgi:NitT/TauT family transport system permease protein